MSETPEYCFKCPSKLIRVCPHKKNDRLYRPDSSCLYVRLDAANAELREATRIIKQGKAQFAPNTTNSDADAFLARHGGEQ